MRFPSGRSADEVVPRCAEDLAWMANLGCLELHPHPVRAEDLDHPDELRIDLDPVPGVRWRQVREVAVITRSLLEDFSLAGYPKTSGKRGLHIYVRIEPRWGFDEVRRAALALALRWEEVADCEPGDFTLASMPARFKRIGDPHAAIDARAFPLDPLLDLFERQGQGDAPWPPYYRKRATGRSSSARRA
ncbi:MAG TPA: DNA primase small subunit domain-containing protein [Burkholderiales bacterium]|nr:DNA primase small subunit domain-containing protein [Burkholderiales bacterium]